MKLKDLIKTKENWTQKANSRDEYGNLVSIFSKKSCSFCLHAGLIRIYPSFIERDRTQEALGKLAKAINTLYPERKVVVSDLDVISFNDDPKTKFKDIKKVIELADV